MPNGLFNFIEELALDNFVTIKDPFDPEFIKELNVGLVGFGDNNIGTLNKLIIFNQINADLKLLNWS